MYVFITALSTSAHASTQQHMNTKNNYICKQKYIHNVTTCKQLYAEYHKVETLESLQSLSYWMRLCRFYRVNSSFSLYIT